MSDDGATLKPLDSTLVRVVLLMRGLGWAWLIVLGIVTLVTGPDDLDTGIVVASMVVATGGTLLTAMAARRGFLDNPLYVAGDGVVAISLAMAGPLAGVGDFIAGGYPASWLFVVAYASSMEVTAIAGAVAGALFAVMHVVMDLGATRAYGSVQFLVIAVVVGWGFDALRRQERLRLTAETERETARSRLADEQARAARLEERSAIAVRLHDSVLQTLGLIRSSADDAAEVRYLARSQERDLRRTIAGYESPYEDSFRSRLLDLQADIEDMYRIEISQVVKDDAEMDDSLHALVGAVRDVVSNAVSSDGATRVDLFAEFRKGEAEASVRTFPTLGRAEPVSAHIQEQLDTVGADLAVREAPGNTREVTIRVRR